MDEGKNVVLITVDCLRADSAYDREVAPTMNKIGDRGTVFKNVFSRGSWTPFSFPSILSTGNVFSESQGIGVENVDATLAEILGENGYKTAGYSALNGFVSGYWGYDRGFDDYRNFAGWRDWLNSSKYLISHPTTQAWIHLAATPFRNLGAKLTGGRSGYSQAPVIEEHAEKFLEETDGNFFLWLHYMDCHIPYSPEDGSSVSSLLLQVKAGLGKSLGDHKAEKLRDVYEKGISRIDSSVKDVLESLEKEGLREDTCIIIAGDHGEEFMEHGNLAHYPKLHNELVHVPLIIDHPDGPSREIDDAVGLDVVPATVCEIAGVETEKEFDGESVAPTVFQGEETGQEPVISVAVRGEKVTTQPIPRRTEDGDLVVSARTRDWTYIDEVEGEELYDRRKDPMEKNNLLGENRSGESRTQNKEKNGSEEEDKNNKIAANGAPVEELRKAVERYVNEIENEKK